MSKSFNQLKNLSARELESRMDELKRELMKLQSQVATRTLPEKPGRIKQIKRTIARIITLKHAKEVTKKA